MATKSFTEHFEPLHFHDGFYGTHYVVLSNEYQRLLDAKGNVNSLSKDGDDSFGDETDCTSTKEIKTFIKDWLEFLARELGE